MMSESDYILNELAWFHSHPPLDEYSEGYFDGLAWMGDYFGILKIDSDPPARPSRPKLTVIQGGKE